MLKMERIVDVGRVANTHGITGELKFECWCDSPEFLQQFKTLQVGQAQYTVVSIRPHKHLAIVRLEGVNTVEAAQAMKGRVVKADVSSVKLPEGRYFAADLIGLTVVDEQAQTVGTLAEVLFLPAHDVYVVRGEREVMIPAVPAFIKDIDMAARRMQVALIEGL